MVTDQQIRDLAARIAAEFHPQRIILFGSRATGHAREDSDVDLLVILPFDGRARALAVQMLDSANPRYAVDLLVRTPEEIRWRYEQGDPIVREAMDRGIVLYETAA
jgi:uncharacterized protein